MQYARALLRHLSRLWIIVLRTTLIMVITIISVAGVAFQWYAESVSIVGQSGTATGRGIGLQEPIRITFSHPMDEARVTNGLTVTPRTPINMRWNAQSTELGLHHAAVIRAGCQQFECFLVGLNGLHRLTFRLQHVTAHVQSQSTHLGGERRVELLEGIVK